MQLTDTTTNTKTVYIYFKDFEWYASEAHESNVGHPKKSEVYRAILNTDTKTYRVFYEVENKLDAVYLASLITDAEADYNYRSDAVEITKANILELQLKETQLDQIVKWSKENNKPIADFMGLQPAAPSQQQMNAQQVKEFIDQQEVMKDFTELGQFLGDLLQADPALYNALADFIYSLSQAEVDIDADYPSMSPVLGAGTNISKALKHIRIYGSEDRRTNLNTEDLHLAMQAILEELVRRQFHQA